MGLFEESWPFTRPGQVVANQKTVAEKNRINILGLIARRHCLSQRQLTLATGLRPSTIHSIVSQLKSLGIVRDGAPIKAERAGPKETELQIDPASAWSAGISINADTSELLLLDAAGNTLRQETLPTVKDFSKALAKACKRITAIATDLRLPPGQFAGTALSIPGVVDPARGVVLNSHSLQLRSFPAAEQLRAHLPYPVWVERDVACGAYAEHNIGAAVQTDSFAYFALNTPPQRPPYLGLALVLGEQIFRGGNHAAGELGELFRITATTGAAEQAAVTAENADAFYQSVARVVANIVNILDVRSVVFATAEPHLNAERFATLTQQTHAHLVSVPERQLDIRRSALGTAGIAKGSALLALHRGLAQRLAGIA